ncbi:NAD-dependent epimerase/dehydratase family protein [Glycomyces harbinensis]|uniref:dTDP-L-rhamnose 4-epimerase n=1 Tax=Glycomyces harbinensis TaxID=58114 RepID=A0A1G6XZ99_9ACTN|nr:NAD-dependent epimerase/dehydratase family protein [Glycomyces harbinensis]SDD82705.1 dTDP-L-rhamnose 4-epimerase [Glycomyces harbinensis]
MRVLVTGGAGFIGGHIVEQLCARGDDVVVLDSLAAHEGPPDHLPDSVEFIVGDLRDESVLRRAVEGVDAVCHQAARVGLGVDFDDVTDYVADNDGGTANLLRALWRRSFAGRLVVASSMVVYGEGRYRCPEHGVIHVAQRGEEARARGEFEPRCPRCTVEVSWAPVDEETPFDPRNVYAATKVHTEHLSFLYGRESGVGVCALRYHNVYGPRMPRDTPYAGVASIFRSALESGKAPRVFEDGAQTRDFVHVRDVARANLLALDGSFRGACNIASGEPHTVGEMARALAAGFEDAPEPVVTGEYRYGDVRHIVASPELADYVLGFRAETGFAEGMAAFAHDPLR